MATKYFIAPNAWGIFCGMDKTARIDSRTVAEVFEKEHKNVIQAIENLDCSEEFSRLNFQPSKYKNSRLILESAILCSLNIRLKGRKRR